MTINVELEPMLDMYIFETTQLIEQLEQAIINSEKSGAFSDETVNEIFRIMHTIKGSSAMMMLENITKLAHSTEDLFLLLRDDKEYENYDFTKLTDIVLSSIDFIKNEVEKITNRKDPDGDISNLILEIASFMDDIKQKGRYIEADTEDKVSDSAISQQSPKLSSTLSIKNSYNAVLFFEEGTGMENIRALSIIQNLREVAEEIQHIPEDLIESVDSVKIIHEEGFKIYFRTNKSYEEINKFLMLTPFLTSCRLEQLENNPDSEVNSRVKKIPNETETDKKRDIQISSSHQSIISVNVAKLDHLMDLVGELVISEAMVTQNPDLKGLVLESFQKSARQLKKITGELQDIVMSIRMVPLAATFQKMNRIVRDMSKKLSKEVRLEIVGEETEVDKNIIEHISDPLMHIIRNSIDHGLESPEERRAKGKPDTGTVTLEAKNAGGDVLIIVKDDGKGLNREKILKKAVDNGLVNRPKSELSDKEIFSYIFSPGFSTNDKVTEFSGRGVGMDVVIKNISAVGGTVSIDSKQDIGTAIMLKIPLTLAIMGGMVIRVGNSTYTIPMVNIKESFRPKEGDVINDPDGNEMIMIRGECYPILRLHELYKVQAAITNISDGIIVMIETENRSLCILADELIGEQQVVVKPLPDYIKRFNKEIGLAGCTLLGNGSISLILDMAGLIKYSTGRG